VESNSKLRGAEGYSVLKVVPMVLVKQNELIVESWWNYIITEI